MIQIRFSHSSGKGSAQVISTWVLAGIFLFPAALFAGEGPLGIFTRTQVSTEGKVRVELTLTNHSSRPLFHLHPMLHFHHSMSPMPGLRRLDPGGSVTFENTKHPPVKMVGSYPMVAMVRYQENEQAAESHTQMHTDTFYFQEPMASLIEGRIGEGAEKGESRVKILLKNPSPSFKNIRMMLLLPPELAADDFKGMRGFTIRGGEEKYFEVPVRQVTGSGGAYPVHLLVEYGEMLNHYSGDIRGEIHFGPGFGQAAFWPQMLVFVFLTVTLFWTFQSRLRASKPA